MPKPVVFIHIPKTGGSTLRFGLETVYGKEHLFNIARDRSYLDVIAEQRGSLCKYQALTGHMRYDAVQWFHSNAVVFTFMRHPVDRAVSTYNYIKNNPKHPRHRKLNNEINNLEEFIDSDLYEPNSQVLHLAGDDGEKIASEELLSLALERISNDHIRVGLLECYTESLFLLHKACDFPVYPLSLHTNKRMVSAKEDSIDDRLRNQIQNHDHLDMKLFEFARKKHKEKVKQLNFPCKLNLKICKMCYKSYQESPLFRQTWHRLLYSRFSPWR